LGCHEVLICHCPVPVILGGKGASFSRDLNFIEPQSIVA
jgi:hypothetical protein